MSEVLCKKYLSVAFLFRAQREKNKKQKTHKNIWNVANMKMNKAFEKESISTGVGHTLVNKLILLLCLYTEFRLLHFFLRLCVWVCVCMDMGLHLWLASCANFTALHPKSPYMWISVTTRQHYFILQILFIHLFIYSFIFPQKTNEQSCYWHTDTLNCEMIWELRNWSIQKLCESNYKTIVINVSHNIVGR